MKKMKMMKNSSVRVRHDKLTHQNVCRLKDVDPSNKFLETAPLSVIEYDGTMENRELVAQQQQQQLLQQQQQYRAGYNNSNSTYQTIVDENVNDALFGSGGGSGGDDSGQYAVDDFADRRRERRRMGARRDLHPHNPDDMSGGQGRDY